MGNYELSPEKRRCILALSEGRTVTLAAEVAGVHERTVYKWRQQPDFISALRDADRENLQDISRRLTASTDGALAVLETIMNDGEMPPSVRVRAAGEVLKHRAAFYELVNVDEAMSAMEDRLQEAGL